VHDEAEHAGPAEEAVPAPGRRGLRGRLGQSPAGQSEERAPAATPAAAARPLLARAVTRLLREKVAHIEGPEEGDRDGAGEGGPRGGLRRRGRPLAGSPAPRTRHTRRRGWASAAGRPGARRGLHALPPGEPGGGRARAVGTRGREASLPARPAGSVSQRRGGGSAGPTRTILTAAGPAAREPATRPVAAGARRPLREGAEPPAGARGSHPGAGAPPGEKRGPRGCALTGPRTPSGCTRRWPGRLRAHAPLPKRMETLPSQLGDIRFHGRADVWRCKFKSCHWPGSAWLFPFTSHPTIALTRKLRPIENGRTSST
jgi:hypothetical protein